MISNSGSSFPESLQLNVALEEDHIEEQLHKMSKLDANVQYNETADSGEYETDNVVRVEDDGTITRCATKRFVQRHFTPIQDDDDPGEYVE